MQKRTHANIPPHDTIICSKIPKHMFIHDAIARIYVSQVRARYHGKVPFGYIWVARYDGAEYSDAGEEKEYVASCVGENQDRGGEGRAAGGGGWGGELLRDEGGGGGAGGVEAEDEGDLRRVRVGCRGEGSVLGGREEHVRGSK